MEKLYGEIIFSHVYRCYGFVETDLGPGLLTEMIRDHDGRVSVSLKQYLWESGYHQGCQDAVRDLTAFWLEHLIPSRDLLTHNIVVQCAGPDQISRLVVVDGLGASTLIPFSCLPPIFKRKRVETRIKRLNAKIRDFLGNCAAGIPPSHVGMLIHRDSGHDFSTIREPL